MYASPCLIFGSCSNESNFFFVLQVDVESISAKVHHVKSDEQILSYWLLDVLLLVVNEDW